MDSATDPVIPEALDPAREREVLTEGRGRAPSRVLVVLMYEPAETLAAFGRVIGDALGKTIGERPFEELSALRKLPILSLPNCVLPADLSSWLLRDVKRESDLGLVLNTALVGAEVFAEGYLRSMIP